MRPVFHAKSDRLVGKAGELEKTGAAKLATLKEANAAEYALLRQAIAHLVMGLGGEDEDDTRSRIAAYEAEHGVITDAQLVEALGERGVGRRQAGGANPLSISFEFSPPKTPELVSVKVPPCTSSGNSFLVRARSASSFTERASVAARWRRRNSRGLSRT